MGRGSAEQFRRGKDDQVGRGKTKAAGERSFEPDRRLRACRFGRHDFAETLDFAFGLEIDDDARAGCAPFLQPRENCAALRFGQHEIADREFSDLAILKRARKIFRSPASIHPSLIDVRFVVFLRFDRDLQSSFST